MFGNRSISPDTVDAVPQVRTYSIDDSALIPFGKIALEWRPQERLGISVFYNQQLSSLGKKLQQIGSKTEAWSETYNGLGYTQQKLGENTSQLLQTDPGSSQFGVVVTLYF